MKLQHITVCLNKGAQAVPASFLGSMCMGLQGVALCAPSLGHMLEAR